MTDQKVVFLLLILFFYLRLCPYDSNADGSGKWACCHGAGRRVSCNVDVYIDTCEDIEASRRG